MIQVQYKKNTSMIQVREGDPNTLLKTYRPKKKPIDPIYKAVNEENTLLNQPKIESFVENASGLIKECVAETGGCRLSQSARYARGEPPRAPQRAPLAL